MRVPIDTVYSNTGWRLEKERRREGEKVYVGTYVLYINMYNMYICACICIIPTIVVYMYQGFIYWGVGGKVLPQTQYLPPKILMKIYLKCTYRIITCTCMCMDAHT